MRARSMRAHLTLPSYLLPLLAGAAFALAYYLPYFFYYAQRQPETFWTVFADNDFQNMWLGARAALEGRVALLFDNAAYNREIPHPTQSYAWSYPLHLLLFVFPLGLLPYLAALAIWTAAGLGLFLVTARGAARLPLSSLLVLALSPAALVNMLSGQNGFFTGALFVGGLYLVAKRRPMSGGAFFGILTFKPHIGIVLPFVLLAARQWRTIIAAAMTLAALIGLSLLVWDIETWRLCLKVTGDFGLRVLRNIADDPYAYMMSSVYAGARAAGVDSFILAMGIQLTVSIPVLALTTFAVVRRGLTPETILLAALAAQLISPYSFNYDMTGTTLALILCLHCRTSPVGIAGKILSGLLWALPMLTYVAKDNNLPLVPVAIIACFCWVFGLCRTAALDKGGLRGT